jgi:hypothetical protein
VVGLLLKELKIGSAIERAASFLLDLSYPSLEACVEALTGEI